MPDHSPEPWRVVDNGFTWSIWDAEGGKIADDLDEVDASRIVACVNDCRGVTTEDLKRDKLAAKEAALKAADIMRRQIVALSYIKGITEAAWRSVVAYKEAREKTR